MALIGRTLYYIAGSDDKRIDHAEMYSLNLDQAGAKWVSKASLPEKNNHLGTVTMDGQIYVIGGQTGQDATAIFKKTSYRYNPATNKWSALASFSEPPRSHTWATTVAYKGKIILLGGETAGHTPGKPTSVAAVEQYNPLTNSWSKLNSLPGARSSGAAGVWGEKLIFTTGLSFGTFKAETWIGQFV
jgi:N-acetylneuraminic acid mutarotase